MSEFPPNRLKGVDDFMWNIFSSIIIWTLYPVYILKEEMEFDIKDKKIRWTLSSNQVTLLYLVY